MTYIMSKQVEGGTNPRQRRLLRGRQSGSMTRIERKIGSAARQSGDMMAIVIGTLTDGGQHECKLALWRVVYIRVVMATQLAHHIAQITARGLWQMVCQTAQEAALQRISHNTERELSCRCFINRPEFKPLHEAAQRPSNQQAPLPRLMHSATTARPSRCLLQ